MLWRWRDKTYFFREINSSHKACQTPFYWLRYPKSLYNLINSHYGIFFLLADTLYLQWIFQLYSLLRTVLFWDFTQPAVLIPYRRFGKIYRPHLQGYRKTVPKGRERITTSRCVIAQNSAVFISFATVAWNLAYFPLFNSLLLCLSVGRGTAKRNCFFRRQIPTRFLPIHIYNRSRNHHKGLRTKMLLDLNITKTMMSVYVKDYTATAYIGKIGI
jgi:hypothetical protein